MRGLETDNGKEEKGEGQEMKEIVIRDCVGCPLGDIKFLDGDDDGCLYCNSGKWGREGKFIDKAKDYVRKYRSGYGPIPDWCPLDDYGTVEKENEAEKEKKVDKEVDKKNGKTD